MYYMELVIFSLTSIINVPCVPIDTEMFCNDLERNFTSIKVNYYSFRKYKNFIFISSHILVHNKNIYMYYLKTDICFCMYVINFPFQTRA